MREQLQPKRQRTGERQKSAENGERQGRETVQGRSAAAYLQDKGRVGHESDIDDAPVPVGMEGVLWSL